MKSSNRIDRQELLQAGLSIMKQEGRPLTQMPSRGRVLMFKLTNGETVRVRTCNDHILIAVANKPTPDAHLNIEGTDWVLLVMPETPRTYGKIIAYLLPTSEAVAEARRTHEDWLNSNPNTNGVNRTFNLWFSKDGAGKANNYEKKWAQYRLSSTVVISASETVSRETPASDKDLNAEVEEARKNIAKAAGVTSEAVRITIDFSL